MHQMPYSLQADRMACRWFFNPTTFCRDRKKMQVSGKTIMSAFALEAFRIQERIFFRFVSGFSDIFICASATLQDLAMTITWQMPDMCILVRRNRFLFSQILKLKACQHCSAMPHPYCQAGRL